MTKDEQLITVYIPLINTNEPESQVVEVLVQPGQYVKNGDILCVLETTKATFEVPAEREGYVHELRIAPGQQVTAGDVLCTLSAQPKERLEAATLQPAEAGVEQQAPPDLRITKPAQQLAQKLGVRLEDLPKGPIVVEAVVRELAHTCVSASPETYPDLNASFDATKVVIFGGGGHAKALIDLLRWLRSYDPVGVVDDNVPAGETILGVPVLGDRSMLPQVYADGTRLAVNAVGALTRIQTRIDIFAYMLDQGFGFPCLVHPQATVEPSANIQAGAHVFARAVVGSAVEVGFGAIINTGAIISHDCVIGDYAHIAPGAVLAGDVKIGHATLVGMGVTTAIGIHIGERVRIGNGARVHQDVPPGTTITAGTTWPV